MKITAPTALLLASAIALVGCATSEPILASEPTPAPTTTTVFTSDPEPVAETMAISLLTEDWLGIDGELDNVASLAYEDGDSDLGDSAEAIRDAGNEQNPGWPSDSADFDTWPKDGQVSRMKLTRDQWELIEKSLTEAAPVYDDIATQSTSESADTGGFSDKEWAAMADDSRRVARLIHQKLNGK